MFKRIAVDIECNGLLDSVTEIHCIVIVDVDTLEVKVFSSLDGNIEEAFKWLLEAEMIITFNGIDFDIPVLIKLYPELQELDARTNVENNLDLLLCTRLMYPDTTQQDWIRFKSGFPAKLIGRHSLAAWGYRIGELKAEYKGESSEEDKWAVCTREMIDYCIQDVKVSVALFKKLKPFDYSLEALQLEHDVRRYISWQEQSGVPFDVNKARELYIQVKHDYEAKWREVSHLFPDKVTEKVWTPKVNSTKFGYTKGVETKKVTTVPFNVGSRQQLIDYFKTKYNWIPVDFTEKGAPEMSADVLQSMPYEEAKIIAELFDMRKLMGSLYDGPTGWIKLVKDGRLHGRVITNGAISGRMSHFNPNLGNIPSLDAYRGKECRALFTTHHPDYAFVGGDASALEVRLFAHYLAAWDQGRYAELVLHGDVHTENQKAFGVEKRSTAKTLFFAMLYGCGAAKAGLTVDPHLSEAQAKTLGYKIIGNFKSAVPAYRELVEGVYRTLDTRGYLIGLDGRKLVPRSKHAGLNTLIQGAGAIVMKKAIVFFHEEWKKRNFDGFPCLMVHDEIQCVVRKDQAPEVAELIRLSIIKAGEYFKLKIPMDGASKIGSNWLETH